MVEMQVESHIVSSFRAAFFSRIERGKRIALYGLSEVTGEIVSAFPKGAFLGLLDGFQTTGEMYGLPILSLEEAQSSDVEHIVIVARAQSVRIIANRIRGFCRAYGIGLWDSEGDDLLVEAKQMEMDHPYFALSPEAVKEAIRTHEVISFDVFDTLLMRRTLYPTDVFHLLEKRLDMPGFARARMGVEHALYREKPQPTLMEIYAGVKDELSLSAETVEQLHAAELALERQVLLPREDVVGLFRYALELGKRVCIISDMYLSKGELEDLLHHHGIHGYHGLYVSSDRGTGKCADLFSLFQAEVGAASYLHIGDNIEADVESARAHGMDAIELKSALSLAEISAWNAIESQCDCLEERLLYGQVLAQVFNSPFALHGSKGRPTVDTAYSLGYVLLAPIAIALFTWVVRQAMGKADTILWSARDGYLFFRLFSLLERLFPSEAFPVSHYFYTSRMAAASAAVFDEDDVEKVAAIPFSGSPRELMEKRFFLDAEDVEEIQDGEMLPAYVMRHARVILERASELRENYLRYTEALGLPQSGHIAFFDLVSSGSCQLAVEKVLGRKIDGLYLVRITGESAEKDALGIASYAESAPLYQLQTRVGKSYMLLENLIMSQEASVAHFDAEGAPVFVEENRSDGQLTYTDEAQRGVLEFVEAYLSILGSWRGEIRPELADAMYGLVRQTYTKLENCVFAEEAVRDDFMNRDFRMEGMFA